MLDKSIQPIILLAFLREHRNNEAHFKQINECIATALKCEDESNLCTTLKTVQDKYAAAYTTAREQGGSAWPEFERYVSELEKCLVAAGKEA